MASAAAASAAGSSANGSKSSAAAGVEAAAWAASVLSPFPPFLPASFLPAYQTKIRG